VRQVSQPRPSLGLTIALALGACSIAFGQDVPKSELKAYTETIAGTELKFDMLPIPGGTFTLGSPSSEAKRKADEGPQLTVQIAPFWMGKCEVTWDEFDEYAFSKDIKRKQRENVDLAKQPATETAADAVTRSTKPYADMTFGFGSRGNPAICMTHHAAMEYTRWLSAKTGKNYRLPTEAEWEYAAKAGSTTPYSFGEADDELKEYAWYVENAEKPMPVGKKKPNPWGLHDMHGNVSEWCIDFYKPEAYVEFAKMAKPVKEPVVLPTPAEYSYSARGGSWDDDADKLRSAARISSNREWSVQDPQRPQSIWWHTDATRVGFRVVRPLDEQENLKGVRSLVVKGKGTR
jgi:formylglycine-generating enzyme required for sulfatase activity